MGQACSSTARLIDAAKHGDVDYIIQECLKDMSLLTATQWLGTGDTIWHVAAEAGQLLVLKTLVHLLEQGPSGPADWKPLLSLGKSTVEITTRLLNQADTRSQTPLHRACIGGHGACAMFLLQYGADPWAADVMGSRNCLHYAASFGHVECMQAVLASTIPNPGRPPLNAPNNDQTSLANICTLFGMTPLHYAAYAGKVDAAALLIASGANICARSTHRSMGLIAAPPRTTPLHLAAVEGHHEIARTLLAAYAETMSWPDSAAATAPRYQYDPRMLLDGQGEVPFHIARRRQDTAMAEMLHPSLPLAFIFNNDDFVGGPLRMFGPPRLAVLAAQTLHYKLLSDIDLVLHPSCPPPSPPSTPFATITTTPTSPKAASPPCTATTPPLVPTASRSASETTAEPAPSIPTLSNGTHEGEREQSLAGADELHETSRGPATAEEAAAALSAAAEEAQAGAQGASSNGNGVHVAEGGLAGAGSSGGNGVAAAEAGAGSCNGVADEQGAEQEGAGQAASGAVGTKGGAGSGSGGDAEAERDQGAGARAANGVREGADETPGAVSESPAPASANAAAATGAAKEAAGKGHHEGVVNGNGAGAGRDQDEVQGAVAGRDSYAGPMALPASPFAAAAAAPAAVVVGEGAGDGAEAAGDAGDVQATRAPSLRYSAPTILEAMLSTPMPHHIPPELSKDLPPTTRPQRRALRRAVTTISRSPGAAPADTDATADAGAAGAGPGVRNGGGAQKAAAAGKDGAAAAGGWDSATQDMKQVTLGGSLSLILGRVNDDSDAFRMEYRRLRLAMGVHATHLPALLPPPAALPAQDSTASAAADTTAQLSTSSSVHSNQSTTSSRWPIRALSFKRAPTPTPSPSPKDPSLHPTANGTAAAITTTTTASTTADNNASAAAAGNPGANGDAAEGQAPAMMLEADVARQLQRLASMPSARSLRRMMSGVGLATACGSNTEEQEEAAQEAAECEICFDADVAVEISDCGHALCGSCAKELCSLHHFRPAQCPYCRGLIVAFRPLSAASRPTIA